MKFHVTMNLDNSEILDSIIRSFCEQILASSIEDKQKFLVVNGLADFVNDEESLTTVEPFPSSGDVRKEVND